MQFVQNILNASNSAFESIKFYSEPYLSTYFRINQKP